MSPRATPTRAWGKRQWVRLAMCVAGLGIVAVTTCVVIAPQWHSFPSRHGIGGWVCRVLQGPPILHASGSGNHQDRAVVRDHLGFHDEGYAWDSSAALAFDRARRDGTDAYWVPIVEYSRTNGLWAATRVPYDTSIVISKAIGSEKTEWDSDPSLSHEHERAIRQVALNATLTNGWLKAPSALPALIAKSEANSIHIIWSGYALNTVTILGLAMFLCFAPFTIRDARRAWRFRGSTTCKSCGYDLGGLSGAAPLCPECGAPLAIAHLRALPPP
jgi:hypothetical protein